MLGVGGDLFREAVAPEVIFDLGGVEAEQSSGTVVGDGRLAQA
jgi:hypothetical protein